MKRSKSSKKKLIMPTSGWIDDQGNPVEIPEDLEELVESAVHFGESIEKHLQQHSVRSRPDKTGQELLDEYFKNENFDYTQIAFLRDAVALREKLKERNEAIEKELGKEKILEERMRRLEKQHKQDVQSIQWQLDGHKSRFDDMPTNGWKFFLSLGTLSFLVLLVIAGIIGDVITSFIF